MHLSISIKLYSYFNAIARNVRNYQVYQVPVIVAISPIV